MKTYVYYILFGAFLFIGSLCMIQKNISLSDIKNETVENIHAQSGFNSSNELIHNHEISNDISSYRNCHINSFEININSLIPSIARGHSIPFKTIKSTIYYKSIRMICNLIDPFDVEEWKTSARDNNFFKYSLGYYTYILGRIII